METVTLQWNLKGAHVQIPKVGTYTCHNRGVICPLIFYIKPKKYRALSAVDAMLLDAKYNILAPLNILSRRHAGNKYA